MSSTNESTYERGSMYTKLSKDEQWWVERTAVLQRHGYIMRSRFRPGWTPSWLNTEISYAFCEDAFACVTGQIMDATRISDSKVVAIKRIKAGSQEASICQMLSAPERRKDPRNHAVPLLDYFINEENTQEGFLVMPVLRGFDDPPFETVDEVVDFVRQILEGLVFLHEMNVAHRDCTNVNIMMDPKSLYPDGFHPCYQEYTPDVANHAKHVSRRELVKNGSGRVRYYFIDFGISSWVRGTEEWQRYATGDYGIDQDVPELHFPGEPYDPFMVDIFIIGNMIKKTFLLKQRILGFLRPLCIKMAHLMPDMRPTAVAALAEFELLLQKQESSVLSGKLEMFDEDD